MASINFKTLTGDAAIDAAIASVGRRSNSVQLDVHYILVATAADWAACGDVRPVVKHVNALMTELGAGMRKNAVVQYAQALFGFVLHAEDKTMTDGKLKAKDLDMALIANTKWFDFREPPVPQPFDLNALLNNLVGKATTRAAKSKKGDKIDPILLAKLVAIDGLASAPVAGTA